MLTLKKNQTEMLEMKTSTSHTENIEERLSNELDEKKEIQVRRPVTKIPQTGNTENSSVVTQLVELLPVTPKTVTGSSSPGCSTFSLDP